MKPSLGKQRESVRKQVGAAREDPGWFTLPWPSEWPTLAPVEPLVEPVQPEPPVATKTSYVPPDCDPVKPAFIDPEIERVARRENLPPERLRDVIRKESAFYPCAVSPKGAIGLMQLMPDTAKSLGVKDPMDPVGNLDAGARYLRQMLDRYAGDWRLALAAYNAGPGAVDSANGVPPYAETQNYVQDLLGQR
ncbi:MAG: lytic transglycosylase domain-containing protein [Acidobacteria bacterium]|nr:lytic transglycosylase domain-containing protein [Acidobacteriota bacterium]